MNADQRIEQYVQVRDKLKEIEEEYEAKRKPFLEIQNLLTGWIMAFLQSAGADSVKSKHGTAHFTTRYTASLEDPDAFMNFVIQNKKFDLLERRASSTAVRDYVEENKNSPPGCKLTAVRSIGVRRK